MVDSQQDDLVIRAKDIHKTYWIAESRRHGGGEPGADGGVVVEALRGVSFAIRRGEFVSIMGPSGCGKSTLLHVLGCLHKPDPGGLYELDGQPVQDYSDIELSAVRNRKIGVVFQQFNLLAQEDIVSNVALPLVYDGVPAAGRAVRARRLLAAIGLDQHLLHRPSELSGGQSQRVAIARSLVNDPAIILADEPTGNLDSETGREIMAIFQQLNRLGSTIVQVTHDRNNALYSNRIIHLKDGRIEREEDVENPLRAPDVALGLDVADKPAATIDRAVPAAKAPEKMDAAPGRSRLRTWWDAIKIGFKGLSLHKGRAALSMLGIICGVAAVVAVVAVNEGAKQEFTKLVRAFGSNNLTVRSLEYESDLEYQRHLRTLSPGLTVDEAAMAASRLPVLTSWAPAYRLQVRGQPVNVRLGEKHVNVTVLATTPAFLTVMGYELASGRFLTAGDQERRARVCVLEGEIRRELFPMGGGIGRVVHIDAEPYRVVGVVASKAITDRTYPDMDIQQINRQIYIPLATSRARATRPRLNAEIDSIWYRMADETHLEQAQRYLNQFFTAAHGMAALAPEKRDFKVEIQRDKIELAFRTQRLFNWVLNITAAISLVVGGIGIMNIMLANVTERRREVGIRRAVGATMGDITRQFIMEALCVTLFGGLLGLLVGVGLTFGLNEWTGWETVLSVQVMLLAMGFSLIDGLVFGTYPALKAAHLDPIEALQYE